MARKQFSLVGEGFRRATSKMSFVAEMQGALAASGAASAFVVRFRSILSCNNYSDHHRIAGEILPSPVRAASLAASRQRGVSLLEVMIAVLVLAVGILGAASLQLNAIRYSASAGYSTQASLIASDLLDRMRANSSALENYAASVEGECTRSTGGGNIAVRDLADFTEAITCYLPSSTGAIVVSGDRATITINWSEARTVADEEDTLFVVSSVVR